MDPRHLNGGVFLGLDGVVIKSHGGTDALGYAGAIEIGYEMVRHRLLDRIRETLVLADDDERAPVPSLPAQRSRRALRLEDQSFSVASRQNSLRSVVLGIGSYLPEQIVTNADLEARVDTTDEWIVQRTGIRQRHIADKSETTSTLATRAAEAALRQRGRRRGRCRPHHRRDIDARLHVSRRRHAGPGGARHSHRRGL